MLFAFILVGALVLLVVLLAGAGILVTHKVAGPIYKMKRQIRALGKGSLQIPAPLRRGDELVDFFDTFNATVRSLRERQEMEIALLDKAIEGLRGKMEDEHLEALLSLRAEMQSALDT
jgi:nitrogen fixation/metabolism regulation signal transduction histidine kinase